MILNYIFCVFMLVNQVQSASILALFSSLAFADHLVFRGYVSLLTQQGHSIVVMTPYPGHFQYPDTERIVELDVGDESAPFWEEFKALFTNTDDYFLRLKAMNELSLKLVIAQLKSKQMTALLINPNIKFDLVVTEADVPVLYAFAEKYQAPHVAITASSGKIHQFEAKGNPIHPLLFPDVNTMYHGNLTTWQKISVIKRFYQTRAEYYNNYLPLSEFAAKTILGLTRNLQDVESDIDLLFIASSPLLVGVRPTVPAITYVDRMHIRTGLKLSQDLQTVLDSATKGAVYFSVGALQEPEQFSTHLLETLTEAFRELPFTVLWKIGNTSMVTLSDNIVTQTWFPQQEVLAHPNIKAFITHGGPRSLEEAVFYQVPIVGLPLVQSRKVFIEQITVHGAGQVLDPYYITKETVKNVINDVATNPSYKKSMSKLAKKVVDPTVSGPDNAVWWTEYVLKNGGARHLRCSSIGVNFTAYYMLDLLIYLIIPILLAIYLIIVLLRSLVRRLYNRIRGFWRRDRNPTGKFKAL